MENLAVPNTSRCAFLCLLILSVSSCSDNEAKPDYSSFLKLDYPMFAGKIDGKYVFWKYGLEQFQMSQLIKPSGSTNDSTDFSRFIGFSLISDDTENQVDLVGPIFNILDNNWQDEFRLTIVRDGNMIHSSLLAEGEIAILQVQEFSNPFNKPSMRVWLTLRGKLSSARSCSPNDAVLTDGLMIAEFWDYKRL